MPFLQNYTLEEIEKLKMQVLYELVKEYYTPEFAKESIGDINSAIENILSSFIIFFLFFSRIYIINPRIQLRIIIVINIGLKNFPCRLTDICMFMPF